MQDSTTIKITKKMREEIERRKTHPRQSNAEVVEQALNGSGDDSIKHKKEKDK